MGEEAFRSRVRHQLLKTLSMGSGGLNLRSLVEAQSIGLDLDFWIERGEPHMCADKNVVIRPLPAALTAVPQGIAAAQASAAVNN